MGQNLTCQFLFMKCHLSFSISQFHYSNLLNGISNATLSLNFLDNQGPDWKKWYLTWVEAVSALNPEAIRGRGNRKMKSVYIYIYLVTRPPSAADITSLHGISGIDATGNSWFRPVYQREEKHRRCWRGFTHLSSF